MSALPDPARWQQLDAWLREALDLDAPDRSAWLATLAVGDPESAATLARLLAGADDTDLEQPVAGAVTQALAALDADDMPERIGAWRLLEPLGRGGMADVWLAERDESGFVQRAALKRLAPGMATPELVARFAQERQILATLDDPGIARLIDGGVDDRGLPWLALEYVEGEDIARWCDARRAGVAARVALLARAAAAVARAHARLVVHRDIKPSNVLVGADGAVRLLDFGIAKLLDPDSVPHAAPPTGVGARALTPAYASPEQLRGEPVTVASDVYQLGLLAHELLTGVQPFRAGGATPTEVERRIVEGMLDPPSAVAWRDADAGTRAAARAATPAGLVRALRGDLDVIVQRAMARRPSDRYATVDAFRDDLDRHLSHRPILARPPTLAYQAGRWLRRNARVAVAAGIALALAATYLVATVQHSKRLEREIAVSRAVREYALTLLQVADPGLAGGRTPNAEQILAHGAREATTVLQGQPAVQSEVLSLLAQVHLARTEAAQALPLAQRALELQRTPDGGDPVALEGALSTLGTTLLFLGRLDEAEPLARESLALRELREGADGPGTLEARFKLAALLHHRGEFEPARAELADLIELAGRDPGTHAAIGVNALHELADIDRDAGRLAAALAGYARVVAIAGRTFGPMEQADYGRCLLFAGQRDAAAPRILAALDADLDTFGPEHMMAAIHRRNRALLAEAGGDPGAAADDLAVAIAIYDRSFGRAHFYSAQMRVDLGYALLALDRSDEAEAELGIARKVLAGTRAGGHPLLAGAEAALGFARWRSGDRAAARGHFDAALASRRRDFGADHPYARVIEEALDALDDQPSTRVDGEAERWFEIVRVRTAVRAASAPRSPG